MKCSCGADLNDSFSRTMTKAVSGGIRCKLCGEITATDGPVDTLDMFDGPEYIPVKDTKRLAGQMLKIWNLMKDEKWRTLDEISDETGAPEASVSAQLRHLRKEKFGAHRVNKRPRGKRTAGLFEYQLIPSEDWSIEENLEEAIE